MMEESRYMLTAKGAKLGDAVNPTLRLFLHLRGHKRQHQRPREELWKGTFNPWAREGYGAR